MKNTTALLPHEVYQQQTDQKAAEKTRMQSERRSTLSRRGKPIALPPKLEQSKSLNFDDDRTETEDDGNSEIPDRILELKNPEDEGEVVRKRGYFYNAKTCQMERIIRKRMRKTGNQLQLLLSEFENDPHWTKETLQALSNDTRLTEAQVYKWGWD